MSDRVLLYIIIGAFLFAVGLGIFAGWHLKPNIKCPVIKDTLYVKGDTIPVPYPVTVIKWKEKQPAIHNPVTEEYEGYFDSSFVSNNDTIEVDAAVIFMEKTKEFLWDIDIEHKDYESFRVDSVKYTVIEIKEIEVDNSIWIYTTIVGGILLILSIIFGG